MNLEAAEQRVLSYLKQVSNPLARFRVLLAHVREDEALADIGEQEFLDFLQHHELFRVIEPAAYSEGLSDALADVGLLAERCVMLETRRPTPDQVAELMEAQLNILAESLGGALRAARERGDEVQEARVRRVLDRTQTLRKKLETQKNPAPSPKDN